MMRCFLGSVHYWGGPFPIYFPVSVLPEEINPDEVDPKDDDCEHNSIEYVKPNSNR